MKRLSAPPGFARDKSGLFMPARAPHERRHRTMVIDARAAGVGQGIVFHSDWSTGTGTGDAALRDTDKDEPWNTADTGAQLEIVSASGEGLSVPFTNVAKLVLTGSTADWFRLVSGSSPIPTPAIGEYLYFRWYHGLWTPDGSDYSDLQHVVEQNTGGFGAGPWAWQTRYQSGFTAGRWSGEWGVSGDFYRPPNGPGDGDFDKEAFYRWELSQLRESTTTYSMRLRAYNMSDTLLFDDGDYENFESDVLTNATFTYDDSGDPDTVQRLQMGINGFSGSTFPFTWGYYAAVAVRHSTASNDWIGPYSGGI